MLNAIGNRYGIYSKTIFNNYQQGAVPAVSSVKKVSKDAVLHTSIATQQFSKEMGQFLNDYRDKFTDLKLAADHLNASVNEGNWNQTESETMSGQMQTAINQTLPQMEQHSAEGSTDELGSDLQTVRSAVETMVDAYNQTIQFMQNHGAKNSSASSQMQTLLPDVSAQTMEQIGLTYADDGTLNFDSEVFDGRFDQDQKQTQKLLRDTCHVAGSLHAACDRALTQPSNSLVQADQVTRNLQNAQQRNNGTNLPAGVYSRNGSYGMMNLSAMGMFLNVKA